MDRKVFEQEMTRLELRFGVEVADPIKDDYLDILTNDFGLTTEEFQTACRVIRSDARTFPVPKDFETAIRPDGDELAVLEWQAIVEFWALPASRRERLVLSSEGEQAYKALGGSKLTAKDMHDYRLMRDFATLRRSFAKKTKAAASPVLAAGLPRIETRALPEGSSHLTLLQGSAPKTIGLAAGETNLTHSAN